MNFIIMGFGYFLVALFASGMTGCGYQADKGVRVEYEDQDQDVVPYSFSEIQATCGKCHNASAPAIPISDEAAFKASAKVLAEIESGDMPPTQGSFVKAKAIAFIKGIKPKTKGEAGYEDY